MQIVRNVTTTTIVLADLLGLTLYPNDTVNLLDLPEYDVKNSTTLISKILSKELILNDGANNLDPNNAISAIRGYVLPTPMTVDGKKMVMSTPRVVNTYAYFTGSGDAAGLGGGEPLTFDIAVNDTQIKNLTFSEDVHLMTGKCMFTGASLGTNISMHIVAPPNVPFPAAGNGNCDLDANGLVVMNTTSTGAYWINPNAETILSRFVNKIWMLGDGYVITDSPEAARITKGLVVRIIIENRDTPLKAVINLTMFRKNPR